ncbi:NmrA family NAD(P)-binding protein [Streptomyces sp900116325]|uniref:NmrA family NAD(P)-binding protein n=1 Tax=Streptomyces sp. 900116325 TaxID=3154295 RepID=UPI0033B0ECF4
MDRARRRSPVLGRTQQKVRSLIAISGAAGATGRHILRALTSGGHPVRALVLVPDRGESVRALGGRGVRRRPDPAG